VSKGALGMLSAYWPEDTARYAHVPLQRVTEACVHAPAASSPDRTAIATAGQSVAYGELRARVASAAAALRARGDAGQRVAVVAADPIELVVAGLAALEADRLAWWSAAAPAAGALAAFAPELVVVGSGSAEPAGTAAAIPLAQLAASADAAAAPRPKLRNPILALPGARGGEVLHNHKTLLATAIAFGSFFMLEPGATLALLAPPSDWLGLAALLAALRASATVCARWGDADALPDERIDYAVVGQRQAEARFLAPGSRPAERIGIGAVLGIEAGLRTARRRRLARRLQAPVLTVFGRNDLGPVLASHPSWFLEDAAGIPLPNVDLRPLDPADGRELSIGWDAVEEAEMGVKSALAPAGGEASGQWLRTREVARVDPTGCYFLRPPSDAG